MLIIEREDWHRKQLSVKLIDTEIHLLCTLTIITVLYAELKINIERFELLK